MTPPILNTRATGAVPKPPREGVAAARLQFATEYIALHAVSIAAPTGWCTA